MMAGWLSWWTGQPGMIRLAIVLGLLAVLLLCQRIWPTRGEGALPRRRWRNIGLAAISSALVLVVPVTTVVLAAQVQERGFGLLSLVRWPAAIEFVLAIVVLDMAIYWQHRWFHQVPLLWRIHRVHHSDTQFETTLGLRFHPAEILLSLFYKFALIIALGPSVVAVVVYEILLAAFALFTHTDVAIPPGTERALRRLIVTPDWHRVHHSVHRHETDSNYGNFLTVWDRVFASRIEQPADGHREMQIGLPQFREPGDQTLAALLRLPLANAPRVPSNRQ
jgi:sterol desaturase/sphingolipid hydroxylase (fatty acid hydroxylase superfamily)